MGPFRRFESFSLHDEFENLDSAAGPDWWLELTSKAMELDNSWDKSAGEYLSLYQSVRVR
jgi:glycogen synthase